MTIRPEWGLEVSSRCLRKWLSHVHFLRSRESDWKCRDGACRVNLPDVDLTFSRSLGSRPHNRLAIQRGTPCTFATC